MVNDIKVSALNTNMFWLFCEDSRAVHHALFVHTQVRWLSKVNMFQRVREIFNEVLLHLEEQGKTILMEESKNGDFHIRLA